MVESEQARAYAAADFEEAHSRYVMLFCDKFPDAPIEAKALDIGCGPCDVTFRFARTFPQWHIDAVDGSPAMMTLARKAAAQTPDVAGRIRFVEGLVPSVKLPEKNYDVIFSSSLLHHLPDGEALWQMIKAYARAGTVVFVADLRRPASREQAKEFVQKYSGREPAVLQRDFYNSLLAAFTPEEVRQQLAVAGLGLNIEEISDRHLIVYGVKR
jgi:ubiquinone/menaquinone biosynthesis C-methylase UbiE